VRSSCGVEAIFFVCECDGIATRIPLITNISVSLDEMRNTENTILMPHRLNCRITMRVRLESCGKSFPTQI
jgi:hypothetical protein